MQPTHRRGSLGLSNRGAGGANLLYLINVLAIVLAAVGVVLAPVVGRTITPGAVTLVIAGTDEPSNRHRLRPALGTEDFPDPTLEVDWVQSDIITSTADGSIAR